MGREKVKKWSLSVSLCLCVVFWGLGFSYGISSYIKFKKGVTELPVVAADEQDFSTTQTILDYKGLVVQRYRELEQEIASALYETTQDTREVLERLAKDFSLDTFKVMEKKTSHGVGKVNDIGMIFTEIRNYDDLTQSLIQKWKQDMDSTVRNCTHSACTALKMTNIINSLSTNLNFDDSPDSAYLARNIVLLWKAVDDQYWALKESDVPRFLDDVSNIANASHVRLRVIAHKEEERLETMLLTSEHYTIIDGLDFAMNISKHTSEICEITSADLGERAAGVNVPKSDDYHWNTTNKILFRELVTSKMWDVNVTALLITMKRNVTLGLENFSEVANALSESADLLQHDEPQVASSIRENVATLKQIKTENLIYLGLRLNEFLQENKTLEGVFDLNHSNLTSEVFTLLSQAESFMGFNREGRLLLEALAPKFEAECRFLENGLSNRLRNDFRAIDKRGSSFGGLNATDAFAQNHIFFPLNGIWMSIAWCHVWFIVSVFLGFMLRSLCLKESDESNSNPGETSLDVVNEEFQLEECPTAGRPEA